MAAQLASDLARSGLYGLSERAAPVDTFLRLDAVKQATGLSRSTIYELMDSGLFPRAVKLVPGSASVTGSKVVGWPASEIVRWQRDRIAARDAASR